jgi:hypothetical protein
MEARFDGISNRWLQFRKDTFDLAGVEKIMSKKSADKVHILVSARRQFTHRQIGGVQTQSRDAICILILNPHQTRSPMGRQDRSIRPHAMGIVAKCLVKRRLLADGTVHQIRLLRGFGRIQIGFLRYCQFGGRIGKAAKNRLTSDDDQLARVRDTASRTNQMFKIGSLHEIGDRWPTVLAE